MTYTSVRRGMTVMHHGTPRIVLDKTIMRTGREVVWLEGVVEFVLVQELEPVTPQEPE